MGKLHNDEVSDLSNMIRMIRSRRKREGNEIRTGEKTQCLGGGGKPGGERPFGRPGGRWKKLPLKI